MRKLNQHKRVLVCLLACLSICSLHAQQNAIRGKVTNSKGEPVPGANVIIKETKKGTFTAQDGTYSINPSTNPTDQTLVFSSTGYVEKEEPINSRTVIDVVLQDQTNKLDEVLVVAYGTAKKSTYTGSAVTINSEKISKISGSGFAETLQGMSAGVNVVNNEGNPGGDTRIQIRGIGSMSASANPLYVVDGMPYDGKLTSISPSDIESMTVLKDAAAASLYGSRAANGVIVITTKKGKAGQLRINFKSALGTSDLAVKNPTKANPYQQLTNTWEGLYNDQFYKYGQTDAFARQFATDNVLPRLLKKTFDSNGQPIYVSPFKYINEDYVLTTGEINPDLKMAWNPADYDAYGAVYSRKLRQDYSMDVSGASKDGKTNYFFSTSYLDDKGYGLTQYYKRYGFRANISTQVTNWLEVGGNMAYSNSRQNTSGFIRALVFSSTIASPWLRNKDNTDWVYSEKTGIRMLDFGTYVNNFFGAQPLSGSGDYWNNPNDFDFNNVLGSMISSRFYASAKLPFDIKFRTNISIDDNLAQNISYGSAVHGGDQLAPYGVTVKTNGGTASRDNNRITSLTWNNLLTYDKRFGNHSLNVLAGQELYSYRELYNSAYGEGIMQLGQFELASTTKNWSNSSYKNMYGLLSFLGKVDYGFMDKYYLSASVRSDGSSKFSKNNRWGNFFSAGASWKLSQEAFIKNIKWIDFMSLRASYGTSGNDKLQDQSGNMIYYAYQGTYKNDNMYNIPGLNPATIPTPNLKWEKNAQFNAAVDFKLFHFLNGTVEYYERKSKDLLYRQPIPLAGQVGGVIQYNTNLGDISNRGFEITLGATAINKANFRWNIDANWSSLTNKVTYLPGDPFLFTERVASYRMEKGHSRYEFYMPSSAGVDPKTGNALYWITDASGKKVTTDNFSNVTANDYAWQGSPLPKGYGAITNSFQYKGFDASFMFYYSYGSKMFDYTYMERVTLRGGVGVIQDLVGDRWRKPGDNALLPRWSADDYGSTRKATNFWIFNNDYVRLRNLSLGYTFPKQWLQKAGISRLRIYASGDNLLTFGSAKRRYSDPETGVTGNNYNGNSVTDNGYPGSRRVYMGGVQISL